MENLKTKQGLIDRISNLDLMDHVNESIDRLSEKIQGSIDKSFLFCVYKMEERLVPFEELEKYSNHIVYADEDPVRHELRWKGKITIK
jgi:hypothetical protein